MTEARANYLAALYQEPCPACGKNRRMVRLATPVGLLEWRVCDHCKKGCISDREFRKRCAIGNEENNYTFNDGRLRLDGNTRDEWEQAKRQKAQR